jgi:hypothetical protein
MSARPGIIWLPIVIVALAGCTKSTPVPLMAAAVETEPRLGPGAITEESVISTEATVVSIDHATRMVTLRTPDQRLHTLRVDPSVRNLGKVRKGDEVVTTYYEAIAVAVKKAGKTGVSTNEDTERARAGQKPGGVAAETTTITARVVKIDRKHRSLDLRGPEGNVLTVDVQDPAQLQNLAVGDLVEVSVTEAVAMQVEKAPK